MDSETLMILSYWTVSETIYVCKESKYVTSVLLAYQIYNTRILIKKFHDKKRNKSHNPTMKRLLLDLLDFRTFVVSPLA